MLELINKEDLEKRKRKYSPEYCLYYIIIVFTELQKWSSLRYVLPKMKKRHFTLIHKTHLLWSKLDLYKKAHLELQRIYKNKQFKFSKNLELFIDSTDIYNKRGIENIGYGHNPKKQVSRLSLICDINKNIHSITLVNANTKIINPKQERKNQELEKQCHMIIKL
jgi:hypothetical protein